MLTIPPRNSRVVAILLQIAYNKLTERGENVPNFRENFFEELASCKETTLVELGFKYLEFSIAFVEALIKAQDDENIDSSDFWKILGALQFLRTDGMTIN